MINQITKVLDQNKIKYYTDVDGEISLIYIDIQASDDDCEENIVSLLIMFPTDEQPEFIVFNVCDVCKIPSNIRSKVKNYILEYNVYALIGGFAIRKTKSIIEYNFTLLPTYLDGGQAAEIKNLTKYIFIIKDLILNVRDEVKSMNSGFNEIATIENLKNV
jgi:hypothetical protein